MTKHLDALSMLIDLWDTLCPDADRGHVTKVIKEAQADGMSRQDQCRFIVGMLYDGLAYGNWPSVLGRKS